MTKKILVDEITKINSLTSKILAVLASVGIATDGQLVRLCTELTNRDVYKNKVLKEIGEKYQEVLKEARRITSTEGYIACKKDVLLPKHMGASLVNVWYLTTKGVAAIKIFDEYFDRYAVAGLPCGTNLSRIPHELAVTECFLLLCERQTVCDFIPERELKRTIMKRRYELLRESVNPDWVEGTNAESTGDFKAVLLPKENRKAADFTIEGEAAINYRREQIAAKPNGMLWFVTSKTQQEMVAEAKKDEHKAIWLLGDVNKPFAARLPEKDAGKKKTFVKLGTLEHKIERHLKLYGGGFTCGALAVILNDSKGNISNSLQRLMAMEIVISDEIKLTPTRGRGRPNKLFWHKKDHKNAGFSRAERLNKLIISETIQYLGHKKYTFKNYIPETNRAEFSPRKNKNDKPVIVIFDNPESKNEELSRNIQFSFQDVKNEQANLLIAIGTTNRMQELKEKIAGRTIYNVEKKLIERI